VWPCGWASQVVVTGSWDGDALDDAIQLAASGCACVDQAGGLLRTPLQNTGA